MFSFGQRCANYDALVIRKCVILEPSKVCQAEIHIIHRVLTFDLTRHDDDQADAPIALKRGGELASSSARKDTRSPPRTHVPGMKRLSLFQGHERPLRRKAASHMQRSIGLFRGSCSNGISSASHCSDLSLHPTLFLASSSQHNGRSERSRLRSLAPRA